MGTTSDIAIQIQVAEGGFILTSYSQNDAKTAVYTSQVKLIKAIRALLDNFSPSDSQD